MGNFLLSDMFSPTKLKDKLNTLNGQTESNIDRIGQVEIGLDAIGTPLSIPDIDAICV